MCLMSHIILGLEAEGAGGGRLAGISGLKKGFSVILYNFVLQVQLGGQNDPTRGMGGSTGLFVLRCSLLRFDDFELKESAAIL